MHNSITTLFPHMSRHPHGRRKSVNGDAHIFETAKLSGMSDICLLELQCLKIPGIDTDGQRCSKSLAVRTWINSVTSLHRCEWKLLLQSTCTLMEKIMWCFGLCYHVGLRRYPCRISELISPRVTFCCKTWQCSVTSNVQDVIRMH